jgi:membrane-associated phospholipid phosphatase
MKEFFKNNGLFLSLYFFTLACASYFLLSYDKLAIHQMVNWWVGNGYINAFYKYFTHLGDGLFAIGAGILIMFLNFKKGLYVILSYAFAGITASIIKACVNYTRPFHFYVYYKKHLKLNLVEGVEMLGERSFPSGHATAVFAVFTALALSTDNKFAKVVCMVIAVNAAFSRMYLSQHWLIDVYVGSLIGVLFAVVLYFLFYRNERFDNRLNIFKPN